MQPLENLSGGTQRELSLYSDDFYPLLVDCFGLHYTNYTLRVFIKRQKENNSTKQFSCTYVHLSTLKMSSDMWQIMGKKA